MFKHSGYSLLLFLIYWIEPCTVRCAISGHEFTGALASFTSESGLIENGKLTTDVSNDLYAALRLIETGIMPVTDIDLIERIFQDEIYVKLSESELSDKFSGNELENESKSQSKNELENESKSRSKNELKSQSKSSMKSSSKNESDISSQHLSNSQSKKPFLRSIDEVYRLLTWNFDFFGEIKWKLMEMFIEKAVDERHFVHQLVQAFFKDVLNRAENCNEKINRNIVGIDEELKQMIGLVVENNQFELIDPVLKRVYDQKLEEEEKAFNEERNALSEEERSRKYDENNNKNERKEFERDNTDKNNNCNNNVENQPFEMPQNGIFEECVFFFQNLYSSCDFCARNSVIQVIDTNVRCFDIYKTEKSEKPTFKMELKTYKALLQYFGFTHIDVYPPSNGNREEHSAILQQMNDTSLESARFFVAVDYFTSEYASQEGSLNIFQWLDCQLTALKELTWLELVIGTKMYVFNRSLDKFEFEMDLYHVFVQYLIKKQQFNRAYRDLEKDFGNIENRRSANLHSNRRRINIQPENNNYMEILGPNSDLLSDLFCGDLDLDNYRFFKFNHTNFIGENLKTEDSIL